MEVKIRCVKPFPCILFWKGEFNYKVCELVEVGLFNFYTFLITDLAMFVGLKSFPAKVEKKNRTF